MSDTPKDELLLRRSAFRIGGMLVEPQRNRIISSTGETALEPKVIDVLSVLAGQPGTVLSREAIIDAVWGRAFGADESLTRAISLLRKALPREGDPVIETVARRGYRLAVDIEDVEAESEPATAQGVGRPRIGRRRWPLLIAAGAVVLLALAAIVLLGLGGRGNTAGVAVEVRADRMKGAPSSLAADLGSGLARAALLKVRTSPASGGADYLVSIEPAAAGARASLLDGKAGTLIWSAVIPAGANGHSDEATLRALVGQLTVRILAAAKGVFRKQPVERLAPWQLVLLATWVPGDDEVFLAPHGPDSFYLQRRALELDPKYAPAHASLAAGLAYHALFDPAADTPALRREAASHAEQALALTPYDPGVLYEIATYQRMIGDRAASATTLRQVLAQQPDHPLAGIDAAFVGGLCTAQASSAIARLQQALSRVTADDPVRWVILSHLADLRLAAGDWAGAAQDAAASRAIVRQTWSGITLAAALAAAGQPDAARAISQQTRLEWPQLDWGRFAQRTATIWCMGGDPKAVRGAFADLGSIASP